MYEHKLVFLEHEDWPEWFTLDFCHGYGQKDPPRLILGIAKEPLRRLVDILPKCSVLDIYNKHLQERNIEKDLFIDREFLLDIDKPWGFGGVLEPFARMHGKAVHKHLAEYSITIPRIELNIDVLCENCDGTREFCGMKCFHCGGSGRKTIVDWDSVNRIAATLHVLGIIMDKPDKGMLVGINTKRKQLLSVSTYFGEGATNASIGAVLSRQFGSYLRRLSGHDLPEVKSAIKSAHFQMFPSYRRFGDYFRSYVQNNGQVIIDIPGDACSLYVDGMSRSLSESSGPMELDCHNVDGHHQQLTLLCGLATLAGMARRACTST